MKTVLVGVLTMACAIGVKAEESHPLQPMNRAPVPSEKKCSDLFYITDYGTTGGRTYVVFMYKAPDGTMRPNTVPKDPQRITVYLSESASTYQMTMANQQDSVIFRLTEADYEKSRNCLPDPKPEPKP